MTHERDRIVCAWLGALILTVASGSTAAAQRTPTDTWEVTIAPYLMGASMSGTAGIRGREADVDVSASQVFDNLQFGAMGIVVARKGDWGFGGDAIWAALGTSTAQPPANIDADQGLFGFYAVRRLTSAADLTFGFRWNYLSTNIGFKSPPQIDLDGSKQWVDPLVGLMLRSPEGYRWHAGLYSEIGGFGIGSDIAWQIFPTVSIHVARRFSLDFGYRWLADDYRSGEGDQQFVWDVIMQGPVIGFVFRY